MSLFGNSSRPQRPDLNTTGAAENGARPSRTGDTTFLGEASQVPPRPAETAPPPVATFGTESRAGAAAASQGPTPPERCTNVIASGAKWKGTLTVDDSVR